MSSSNVYQQFAKYYDHYVRDFTIDLQLYLHFCESKQRILEVGCGTGRVLKALLDYGHSVTGIDISEEMLAIARDKLHPYIESHFLHLINHNFVDIPIPESFDCILVTFYTFNYLLEDKEQRSFLRNIRQSLEKRGTFVADLFYPKALAYPSQEGIWNESILQSEKTSIIVRDKREMDGNIERRDQIFLNNGNNEEITTLRRFIPKQEMLNLLNEEGYTNIRFIDSYDIGNIHTLQPNEVRLSSYVVVAERA